MNQRASRVNQDGPRRSTTSSGAAKPRLFSVKRITHSWRRLTTLMWSYLQFVQVKNFLLCMMPRETIDPSGSDSEYEKIPVPGETPKKKEKAEPWRIMYHNNVAYVVGKEITAGSGVKDQTKRTHDPLLCQHPSDKMFARGGRGELKWWTCIACGTRWARIPLSHYELHSAGQSNGNDLVTFGMHAGKTYNTVYHKHQQYCEWVLQTAETGDDPSPQLIKFARYLATKEARDPNDIPAGRMDEEL
jgi:hypothetical protein